MRLMQQSERVWANGAAGVQEACGAADVATALRAALPLGTYAFIDREAGLVVTGDAREPDAAVRVLEV